MDIKKIFNNRDYKFEKILYDIDYFIVYDNSVKHQLGNALDFISNNEAKIIKTQLGRVKFLNNYDVEVSILPNQDNDFKISAEKLKQIENDLRVNLRKTIVNKLEKRGPDSINCYEKQCETYDLVKEVLISQIKDCNKKSESLSKQSENKEIDVFEQLIEFKKLSNEKSDLKYQLSSLQNDKFNTEKFLNKNKEKAAIILNKKHFDNLTSSYKTWDDSIKERL